MEGAAEFSAKLSEVLAAHGLEGAFVADSEGHILAEAGSFEHEKLRWLRVAPEGYRPWIPATPEEIQATNADLEGRMLPQLTSQGDATVYFMRPAVGYFAVAASIRPRLAMQQHWQRARAIADAFALVVARAVES